MNSEIWGPHYWFVIHTIAINYPIKPNALQKKSHYKFIQDLPTFLPDKKSSRNFTELLQIYPVLPYLDSRKDFIKWTHFIHNRVNESLGKDQISYNDFYTGYFNQYKTIEQKSSDYKKKTQMQLYFLTLFLMSVFAYYINKKKLN
jgi:hypothetical protein